MAETAKTSARKAPAKTAAKKAAPRKAATPRKAAAKAEPRKVATTDYVWACRCGKTRMETNSVGATMGGRCPECGTVLTLQD